MAGRFIDLHTHSNASDGTDAPAELVRKAAAQGLAAVAITDHDSLAGLDEAGGEARTHGITLVRGCEIAVKDDFGELHLLGLWMPQPSAAMSEALEEMQKNRRARNQAMLDILREKGMPLTMEDVRAVSGGAPVGRPHIALALRSKGYVNSAKDAFDRLIGWGGQAFIPRTLMTPEEGIRLLHDEGATVALAHPCLSKEMTPERLNDTLSDFRNWGLTAVEIYHSAHDPRHVRLCVKLAARHKLLASGGSDYHGANKPGIALGSGKGKLRIPLSVLEKIQDYRKSKGLWV